MKEYSVKYRLNGSLESKTTFLRLENGTEREALEMLRLKLGSVGHISIKSVNEFDSDKAVSGFATAVIIFFIIVAIMGASSNTPTNTETQQETVVEEVPQQEEVVMTEEVPVQEEVVVEETNHDILVEIPEEAITVTNGEISVDYDKVTITENP